jgi:putative ABC transport system substrate-binding protein
MMNRRTFLCGLTLGTLAAPLAGEAQQPGKVWRIGYLGSGSASVFPFALDAFRQQLRLLGYVEGQNLAIEYRWAADRDDQLPSLAADLVRVKVDVIVVEGHTPAIQAAKNATRTIPIVMGVSGDPVRTGLVASLARPGSNVTGLSIQSADLAAKRLELLREAVPTLARVAVLWNPANPPKILEWKETQIAARALGLKLESLEVRGPTDFDGIFKGVTNRQGTDALIAFSDGLINGHRRQIIEFAARSRLPAMYTFRHYVEDGGLIAYGPSFTDMFRRAAIYVDKLLKGAKPADLPVEQATKFDLVINLKTAKALGLTIPRSLLLRADQVIE